MPKYTGPERRKGPRRKSEVPVPKHRVMQRRAFYKVYGRRSTVDEITASTNPRNLGARIALDHGILEIKEEVNQSERRIHGAGRRKGDLRRALNNPDTEVILDISKTPKSVFKHGYLKKAAKKAGPLGLAISAGNLARELKVN